MAIPHAIPGQPVDVGPLGTRLPSEKTVALFKSIRRAREDEADALTALALRSKAHWGYSPDQIEAWRPVLADAEPMTAPTPRERVRTSV